MGRRKSEKEKQTSADPILNDPNRGSSLTRTCANELSKKLLISILHRLSSSFTAIPILLGVNETNTLECTSSTLGVRVLTFVCF